MVEHGDGARDIEFDIAVVGAGPAGAIAAYAAARRGLRVALIDRSTFPRDKTCGDGIGPVAVSVLREFGLDDVLDGRRRIEAFTLLGPAGERTENPIPVLGKSTDVFVVPRLEFDEHLFRAALAAGAQDLTGTRYLGTAEPDDRARSIDLRDASGVRTVRARLVIGADGAYSAVRKDLVGKEQRNPEFWGVAMRAYAESPHFEVDGATGPRMLFEFSPDLLPSYGWVFPVGGGTINVGVGLPFAQLRERGLDPRQLLTNFVERLRESGIEVGELRDTRGHQLPGMMGMPRLTFARAALIGDAASMINPVSGEGIAYAMTAARRLIEALPDDLTDATALSTALKRFERDFRSDHRLHFLSCRLTMALLRRPAPAAVLIRAIQNDPHVFNGVFDMLLGDGRLHANTAARIVKHALVR